MPRHKGAGKNSNVTINHDDPRMIHLRDHFDYLHKLGEVKAVKVIATVVDGACGLANRQDTDGKIYLPIWDIAIVITGTWNLLDIKLQWAQMER